MLSIVLWTLSGSLKRYGLSRSRIADVNSPNPLGPKIYRTRSVIHSQDCRTTRASSGAISGVD